MNAADLRKRHEVAEAVEACGGSVSLHLAELSLRVRPAHLGLLLNDGHHCQVVWFELADPANAALIDDLHRAVVGGKQAALLRLGLLVQAMATPFLSRSCYGQQQMARLQVKLDGAGKAISLHAQFPEQDHLAGAAMEQLNQVIQLHYRYGEEAKSIHLQGDSLLLYDASGPQRRRKLMRWLAGQSVWESLPSLPGSSRGRGEQLKVLEEILTLDPALWANQLWKRLGGLSLKQLEELQLGVDGKQKAEHAKRQRLQRLLEEMVELKREFADLKSPL